MSYSDIEQTILNFSKKKKHENPKAKANRQLVFRDAELQFVSWKSYGDGCW